MTDLRPGPKALRGLATAVFVAVILSFQGCSPCLGVTACLESTHAAVDGRVLVGETGAPVSGARITLIVNSGAARDSTTGVTDESGIFQLIVGPSGGSIGRMSLRVVPAGLPGYTIDSLPCHQVSIRGDACVLDPIVPAPRVPIHAILVYRQAVDVRVADVPITFTRTGGANWFGPNAAASFASVADGGGVALLFPEGVYATSLDPVIGDLVVVLPPPYGTSTLRGYPIHPTVGFSDRPIAIIAVGPNLDYRLAFLDSTTMRPLAGVDVQFHRTSGIQVAPDSFRGASDITGDVRVRLRPLATGTVRGDLVIRSLNASMATTLPDFALRTFDSDSSVTLARWSVGRTGVLYAIPP